MASDSKKKKRRSRITGWIITVAGALAALVAWATYKADKATLAASAAAHHSAHGAAGLAWDGFAGCWLGFTVLGLVLWGIASLARRKPEPNNQVSRGSRRGRRSYGYER